MYFDSTILVLIPAFLFAFFAQTYLQSTYRKYSQIQGSKGYTGAEVARLILNDNGLHNVRIEPIAGELTDHYDPKDKVVRLSQGIFHSTSLAAVGVAAHECGHAVQDSFDYKPLRLRNAIIPITNIGSQLAMPLILVGLLMGLVGLAKVGVVAYSLMAVFQLITLPVEFNASNRALKIIDDHALLEGEERNGTKKVLQAAALTYVAALLSVLANILRFVLLIDRRDNNR